MITYVWRTRTKTKKINHIQETYNQLWSPMSEGGEQKPKRLIIYKTHTISYDHLCLKEENKNQKHYVWKRRTKTKNTNHIQETHNQLWSPMSERGEQKTKRLIIYKKHTISYDHLCLKEENKTKKTNHIQDTHNQLWSPMSEREEQKTKRLIIYKTHTISYDHICLKEENKNQKS